MTYWGFHFGHHKRGSLNLKKKCLKVAGILFSLTLDIKGAQFYFYGEDNCRFSVVDQIETTNLMIIIHHSAIVESQVRDTNSLDLEVNLEQKFLNSNELLKSSEAGGNILLGNKIENM